MTKEQILNTLKQNCEGASQLCNEAESQEVKQYHYGRYIALRSAYSLLQQLDSNKDCDPGDCRD